MNHQNLLLCVDEKLPVNRVKGFYYIANENLDGLHWLFNSSLEPTNDSLENYFHHLEKS